MTTKDSIVFVSTSQSIAAINTSLMEVIKALPDDDPAADDLMQATKHLILAQSSILKAISK